MLSPRSGPATPAAGEWLIFADTGGLAARLADHLTARGQRCSLVLAAGRTLAAPVGGISSALVAGSGEVPAEGYRQDGPEGYELAHVDADSVSALLSELGARLDLLKGVVYLWGLDAPSKADMTAEAQLEASVDACADFWRFCRRSVATSV